MRSDVGLIRKKDDEAQVDGKEDPGEDGGDELEDFGEKGRC